jgi:hypothetical protein
MVASSLRPSGLIPRYVRPTAGVHLNARNTNTLMQCTWTLLLAFACLLAVSDMLSFWLTGLHVTTGLLVYRISCWMPSSLPFGFFGQQLVPWQDVSTATATGNCLGQRLVSTSLTTTPRSLPALAKRQSSNGLVESHWKIMVHMARAYLTEKQMPCTFWFYAIIHSAPMMNAIPDPYQGHFASPFLLIHEVGHDERTWIPWFSLCYCHHKKDNDQQHSHHQAHTMEGIDFKRGWSDGGS